MAHESIHMDHMGNHSHHDHHNHMNHHDMGEDMTIVDEDMSIVDDLDMKMKMDMNHMDHMGHMDHSKSMSMVMSFHLNQQIDILFAFWHPRTPAQFYLSCLSVLVIGLVYELLKACQLKFIQRYSFRPADQMCLDCCNKDYKLLEQPKMNKWLFQLCHTSLYIMQFIISMLLMLVVMTFNVELFAAVILGVGLGHFITNITENSFEENDDQNFAGKRGSVPSRRDDAYLNDCCH